MGFLPAQEGALGAVERSHALAVLLALGLVRELSTLAPVMRLLAINLSHDAKCPDTGPLAHVRSNLADHLERSEGVHSVDAGQVNYGHPVQLDLEVETGDGRSSDYASCLWKPEVRRRCGLQTARTGFQPTGRTPSSSAWVSSKCEFPGYMVQ